MEKQEYNNLIRNNKLEELSKIFNIDELTQFVCYKRYLIEYLLEKNIHTTIMDNRARLKPRWSYFYIKYDILKPLLNSHLEPLLEEYDNELLLKKLLKKLNNDERMELYHNLRKNSYWLFHDYENKVIDSYKEVGIKLESFFIKRPRIIDDDNQVSKKYQPLLKKFCEVFIDTDQITLETIVHEFQKRMKIDAKRASLDIKRLIDYKSNHKDFKLILSNKDNGEYSSYARHIITSPYSYGTFTHELSHLMYHIMDEETKDTYKHYEVLRKEAITPLNIKKIKAYLKKFHQEFEKSKSTFEKVYYDEINKKYDSFGNYVKVLCNDIIKNDLDYIEVDGHDEQCFCIDEENIVDVVSELLVIEKKDYINICRGNYYSEELFLENLLNALLIGKIYEGKLGIKCLSGHKKNYFKEEEDLSFNECLADYDAIKNSSKSEKLINDLRELVGEELVDFLDDYILLKRNKVYNKTM